MSRRTILTRDIVLIAVGTATASARAGGAATIYSEFGSKNVKPT